jgi:hypothetical protein
LAECVHCNSISVSHHAPALHPSPSQPHHDRVADPIDTVISWPRLDMLGEQSKGLSNMTSFGHRDAESTGGLKYHQKRLQGIA